jgi:hypothetical protein
LCVYPSFTIFVTRIMRSSCCLCVSVSPLIFLFSMRSVSYQTKVGVQFFPEILLTVCMKSALLWLVMLCHLVCYPTFRRTALPPSSESKCKSKKKSTRSKQREPRVGNLVQKYHSKWAHRDTTGAGVKATSVSPLEGHI